MKVAPGLKKVACMNILRHGSSFLLLKRFKEPNKGLYTPVGGKLDPYENPLQAAIRETQEETGIVLDHMEFGGILTETSPVKYNWICYVYHAEIDMMPPPTCDEGILEWIDFEDILKVPTPPTDWHIYNYLLQGKKFIMTADFDKQLNLLSMQEELAGITLHPQ